MAGQAGKKERKKKDDYRKMWKALIIGVTAFYIIINFYFVAFKAQIFSRGDSIGFLVLTTINFALYRLLDITLDSIFFNYLVDLLVINLLVQVMINFHWKFWFLYLLIPCYMLFKGSVYIYHHVKTVGKADPNEEAQDARTAKGKSNSSQKRQIIRTN